MEWSKFVVSCYNPIIEKSWAKWLYARNVFPEYPKLFSEKINIKSVLINSDIGEETNVEYATYNSKK